VREPEPETIARAKAGALAAFEELVRAAQADVWRFAYHLTRDRAAADDVTQETFLRAYRGIGSYGGQSRFGSWLLRIAHNCAVDHHRRNRREMPVETAPVVQEDQAAAGVGRAELRAQIHGALRALPLELREPFVLIEALGYTYRETALILGVPVGTVKSRVHRARALLAHALGLQEATGRDRTLASRGSPA
jgi:RNA polymerase sigma-70 factor, ECF subfamily